MLTGVYLDHNASAPVRPEVAAAVRPWLEERYGNASSIHRAGQEARAAVEHARRQVADLIGAQSAEIVFTSGGTESDNLAIWGTLAASLIDRQPAHIVTTAIEHHAVLWACQELERRGVAVTYIRPGADGRISAAEAAAALRPETRLVAVMLANNETGVLQPVAELSAAIRAAGVPLLVDAVQAVGKIPVRVQDLGCDLLALSGHKLHAPQGIGALYIRRGLRLRPLFYGGRQERERRAGTENLPGIVGLGEAARLAAAQLEEEMPRLAALRDGLESALAQRIPGLEALGAAAPRVPNTSYLSIAQVEGEALVIALDLAGYRVSTGAACSSGAIEPSHVLLAMGLPPERARGSIRISLGLATTAEQIEGFIRTLPPLVERLRALSPASLSSP